MAHVASEVQKRYVLNIITADHSGRVPLSRESLSGESQVFTSSSDCNCIEWKPLLIKQTVCFQGNRESEEKTMALIDEDPKGCTLMWNKLQMKVYSSRTLATDQEFMKE